MPRPMGPLEHLRVVELAEHVAGPYCGKLLADLGATVVKVEPPQGDALRRWGPFPGHTPDPQRGGLFHYLNAGKRGITLDLNDANARDALLALVADADVLVDGLGAAGLDRLGLGVDVMGDVNPDLVVVRISNFGRTGPSRDLEATDFVLQAASGWISRRDPRRPPVQAGARIPEYIGGAFAALGALTALALRGAGVPVEVDVSLQESFLAALSYPMLMHERARSLGQPTNAQAGPLLGIVRCRDDWIGINCLTGQQWLDCCAMFERPDFADKQIEIMMGGPERREFFEAAQPWLDARTVEEILDLGQALRVPVAPVGDGRTMPHLAQYRARQFFVTHTGPAMTFTQPGPPYRFSRTPARIGVEFPAGGGTFDAGAGVRDEGLGQHRPCRDPSRPFEGLRVVDLTTFWAGAYVTCFLGAFGADVVKVESIQRPDGHRYSSAFPTEGDDWYERSALWQATNLNKRDLTLDLDSDDGRALVRRLIARADVVIENYSPRVVEHFGLDYESLVRVKPDIVQVRMPGFGLVGPWKDFVGWALGIEQTTGMAAVTGYPDGPPVSLLGPADAIVGVHAAVALRAALEHRRRTGEGQLVEVAQIEVGANLTAESVIEHSMNGIVMSREGNRHRHHVQGLYPTDDDAWMALTVRDDRDWQGLVDAMGDPPALRDRRFATQGARRIAHDEIDKHVGAWASGQRADVLVAMLQARRVPAERLLTNDRMYDEAHLNARGFYTTFEHPVTGPRRYPGWPLRFTPGPSDHHVSPPPTLGQHNVEILSDELGLPPGQIEALRERKVIGERPLSP